MPLLHELNAYGAKINLSLLNSLTAFVLDTAGATRAQRVALCRSSPLLRPDSSGGAIQEKYGFLYLGELLERYEERFGMSAQDLRAIALALAYTRDLTTPEMFVGPQRENFLRRIRKAADCDSYLAGALYLLDEGRDGATDRELKLTDADYDSTENLLFTLSLFQDRERAFLQFKPQLIRLLGRGRTMPVLGNASVLDWFTAWLIPHIKGIKGSDMALFRALCAMPASHIKPGGKPHCVLLENGYTPLEIAYANMMTVLAQTADGCLRMDSIVSEKIAVDLFREALNSENALAPEIYDQLSQVYQIYDPFKIKCYGQERLADTLREGVSIRNASTFLWFSGLVEIHHPVFNGFDIMDGKWDALAASLEAGKYRSLFEDRLTDDMSREEIQCRLDRYLALTGKDYAGIYWKNAYGTRFGLLVNNGILNLWDLFQRCLDEGGTVIKPEMAENIWSYVRHISTAQGYQFFEKFFAAYGLGGLERFFAYRHRDFFEALTERQGYYYNSQEINLKLHREYLDDDGHRQLLGWMEEYVFHYQPEQYHRLVVAILRDEFTAGLFSVEEQRKLFDQAVQCSDMPRALLDELKRRYLTAEEQQAEQEAEATARQENERRQHEELIQNIRDKYAEISDGTFASVLKFLDEYRYYRDKQSIACRVAREGLDELLESQCYELDGPEAARLLSVCAKLVHGKAMGFTEARSYIMNVKERAKHDTDHLPE